MLSGGRGSSGTVGAHTMVNRNSPSFASNAKVLDLMVRLWKPKASKLKPAYQEKSGWKIQKTQIQHYFNI